MLFFFYELNRVHYEIELKIFRLRKIVVDLVVINVIKKFKCHSEACFISDGKLADIFAVLTVDDEAVCNERGAQRISIQYPKATSLRFDISSVATNFDPGITFSPSPISKTFFSEGFEKLTGTSSFV